MKIREHETFLNLLNQRTFILKDWIKQHLTILDKVTLQKEYSIWLEKTPAHLRYIDIIEKTRWDVNFVHIIRKGEDVIASLYEVTRKHSDKWGGERSLDNCIGRWKRDVSISKKYLRKQNHSFILYEELVYNPERAVKYLCEKLRIKFESSILEKYKDEPSELVLKDEDWKKETSKDIGKRSKFSSVFNQEEQEYVKSKIKDVDISVFKLPTS
jgi:hypothetical protein